MNKLHVTISILFLLPLATAGGCDDFDPQDELDADADADGGPLALRCPSRLGAYAAVPSVDACGEVVIEEALVIDTSGRTIRDVEGEIFDADVVIAPDFMAIVGDVIRIGAAGRLQATGDRALVLAARRIELEDGSAIDVSGSLGFAPAADLGCEANAGFGTGIIGNGPTGGGGGGGFGGRGGDGGDNSDGDGGGLGRAPAAPNRLVGGCGGGRGGEGNDSALGGRGGGVVYLLATEIVVRGTIDAGGGGGAGGEPAEDDRGGGGGGSGGFIILEALDRTTLDGGSLTANGGGGGGASLGGTGELVAGTAGAGGTGASAASGGTAADGQAFSTGGSGSGEDQEVGGYRPDGSTGVGGGADNDGAPLGGGGGGGGGAGVISIVGELELRGGVIAPPPASNP